MSLTLVLSAFGVNEDVQRAAKRSSCLLKRGNFVFSEIVPDASKATLQASIRGKVAPDSVNPTGCWRGYDGLVDIGVDRHFRVNHGNNEFVKGAKHVNGIESLWSYAKHRLTQFHDVAKNTFAVQLKETDSD